MTILNLIQSPDLALIIKIIGSGLIWAVISYRVMTPSTKAVKVNRQALVKVDKISHSYYKNY